MISDELLRMLRCPASGEPLRPADAALVEQLNARIAAAALLNRAGSPVERPLDAALLAPDGRVAYPINDEIPDLVAGDGIPLDQLDQIAPHQREPAIEQ